MPKPKKINSLKLNTAIIGAGGHGKVVQDILISNSDIRIVGFIDDNLSIQNNTINGTKVIGTVKMLLEKKINQKIDAVVVAVGDNQTRANIFNKCKEASFELVNAIHPSVIISKTARLGHGIVIMPGVVINANTLIEDDVCINTNASVDHDNHLKEHCHIWPGAVLTGTVTVGRYSYIGSGAVVLPNLKIGDESTVGAGAVVTEDVQNNIVVIGVPAKKITSIMTK